MRSVDRSPQILIRAALAVLCACAAFGGVSLAGEAAVEDVRFGVNDDGQTRVVIDLDSESKYRVFTREIGDSGKALSVELEQASFRIGGTDQSAGTNKGIGHIGTYAYRSGEDGRSRMIFDLAETAVPTAVFMLKPRDGNRNYRLVIDLSAGSENDFAVSLGQAFGPLKAADAAMQADPGNLADAGSTSADETPMSVIAAAERAAIADDRQEVLLTENVPVPRVKPVNSRTVIVLDAGHGGKDPGSIGKTGVLEKNVTLAAVRQLRDILKDRGYDVILTRDGDSYPELEERITKARLEQADLFMSVHADAAPTAVVRGASVYTLSDQGETRIASQLRKEGDFILYNESVHTDDADVREMLVDIAARASRNESSVFANELVGHLKDTVEMVNNTHREASYVVLLAPDVPAVLLELGFISNPDDEKNLNSVAWRQTAMLAVADSIDSYFGNRPTLRQAMNVGGAQ